MTDSRSGTDTAKHGPGTRLVEAGRRPEWTGAVVNPPVWRGSTHLYENCAALKSARNADGAFFYGRRGAPTQWALADALTSLENRAEGTVLYPSGVAAITAAALTVLRPGDRLLVTDNAYDPSRNMATGLLANFGVEHRFFDPQDLDSYAAILSDSGGSANTAVLLEAPGSLTMEMSDIPALAAIARDRGAISMVDNTWAGPLGFPALERGCDIALMSLTKHVGGHSDLLMGSASARGPLYRKLRMTAQALGHVVSPDDAALALRGLRTMSVRLTRETATALELAYWLQARDEVAHVLYPCLPGDAGHDLWQRDFTGGCGLFSFILKGRDEAARARLIDALELFGIGYSWGGFESLAIPFNPGPIRDGAWPPAGWDAGDKLGVRLSIGLEDAGDLQLDLTRAFAAMDSA
ncbi:Cystathionine beta-lyase [Alteripontixanthobacter maritimus]|uniref:Cystathionine beta-lyase n=1 Tax=Alteripontixanthobacter maritimus TaxID=2161824 RepID=A0A369Q4K7_9SPHN|nr:cystathionine beta-lyase [Alteripontixanthobacter maritimus]RDC59370.1 Cystathionine beta-lyase [Alteripontixanthobacter maritimus]